MITHIDVSSVLRRSVSDLYSNLVTRPTGVTVRKEIEDQLEMLEAQTLTVIDFSHVGLLDFSCADEVVAKLLLRYAPGSAAPQAFFLVQGVSEAHIEAIETVLERHRLALVVQPHDGPSRVLGVVSDDERRAWQVVCDRTRLPSADAAAALSGIEEDTRRVLARLCALGLVMQTGDAYIAVGAAS